MSSRHSCRDSSVRLNGRPAVARLDTGGSFIHLSSEAAAAFGIETVAAERSFAALGWHTVRYGVGDLDVGAIHMQNVPVAVHEGALGASPIADAFGVELGPIVGTNVLQRFLATIDAPGARLILSRRGDADARSEHLARLGPAQEAPFALWSDHLMIARGRVGGIEDANLFVDSGLVVFTPDQGQAAVLASRRALASWGVDLPEEGRLAVLPGPVAIGPVSRDGTDGLRRAGFHVARPGRLGRDPGGCPHLVGVPPALRLDDRLRSLAVPVRRYDERGHGLIHQVKDQFARLIG